MADAIDEMYEAHAIASEGVKVSMFRCTNGETLEPRLALSGLVEHRCPRCKQIIEIQQLLEYRKLRGRNSVTVTCPRVTLTHGRLRRKGADK